MFCFFPAFFCHPHAQIRIILFHDVQRDIPNLEFSTSHVSTGFSQIAFPIIVLPKDDRTDSAQEERLGLPYWTMILAICVVVDESKCLDTPILELSIICEHLPLLLEYKLILRLCCLSIATKQSGDDIHDFSCCHLRCWRSLFSEYCIRTRIVFGNIASNSAHFSDDICPLMMQNEL